MRECAPSGCDVRVESSCAFLYVLHECLRAGVKRLCLVLCIWLFVFFFFFFFTVFCWRVCPAGLQIHCPHHTRTHILTHTLSHTHTHTHTHALSLSLFLSLSLSQRHHIPQPNKQPNPHELAVYRRRTLRSPEKASSSRLSSPIPQSTGPYQLLQRLSDRFRSC